MKKLFLALTFLACGCLSPVLVQNGKANSQEDRAQVMLLGTFHFAYPMQILSPQQKPTNWTFPPHRASAT